MQKLGPPPHCRPSICLGMGLSEEGRREQAAIDGLAVEEPPKNLMS